MLSPGKIDNKFVLLADDDADDRMLFQEALLEVDDNVTLLTATDGEQLMDVLDQKAEKPDLIFLDLNMPRKNGFECLREMKRKEKYKNIPVIVFSTSCQEDSINKVYEAGANFYICKPNNFTGLKSCIKKVFSLSMTDQSQPALEKFVISC